MYMKNVLLQYRCGSSCTVTVEEDDDNDLTVLLFVLVRIILVGICYAFPVR